MLRPKYSFGQIKVFTYFYRGKNYHEIQVLHYKEASLEIIERLHLKLQFAYLPLYD